MTDKSLLPILNHDPGEATVFNPANLMESSRQQKKLSPCRVPKGCLLDFDGELLENLVSTGKAKCDPSWPCFHTRLYRWKTDRGEYGILGGTIGAPFAVLVAEELFACGCQALVSLGSAGLISQDLQPPFFLLIELSLRDEGTSYHYLPAAPFAEADQESLNRVQAGLDSAGITFVRAATWTTDAPFRETPTRITFCQRQSIVAVEMEAAALLAFAAAGKRKVICLSQVTNRMARSPNDFDKGGQGGLESAICLCEETLRALLAV